MSSSKKSLILVFILGLIVGWFLKKASWHLIFKDDAQKAAAEQSGPIRLNRDYAMINPLLFCGVSENKEFTEFKPLEENIEKIVKEEIANNNATNISVYYRVMDSGRWFGINENEQYSPASLLKVPLMIAYLKEAESNPDILSRQITYDGSFDYNQMEEFPPKVRIQAGKSYTIDQLLEATIFYSGNNAEALLMEKINPQTHVDVFTDLGIPLPESPVLDFMSAKSYSYFFRVLYNSSYLNKQMSQKALNMMSKARFDHGIAEGVPKDIVVAEKFGERSLVDDNKTVLFRELHDCGIIYDQGDPYLLCIMTKGDDLEKLSKAIIYISKEVYQYRNKTL